MSDAGESSEDGDSCSDSQDDQKDYSKMSMEELLKLQENIGTKAFNQKVLKVGEASSSRKNEGFEKPERKKFKRANKNRPREVPMMRRAAPRLQSLDPKEKVKKRATRDPRFDDLSGKLNIKSWQENYKFLRETRKKEKEILKEELKTQEDPVKKKKMKAIIQRMENQEREQAKREKEKELEQMDKQRQKEALMRGEKPRYMSNKEKKLLLKAAQFEKLKKGNRVDKYLERKEKRLRVKELKSQRF